LLEGTEPMARMESAYRGPQGQQVPQLPARRGHGAATAQTGVMLVALTAKPALQEKMDGTARMLMSGTLRRK
jgi:hypothetical protein